MPHIILEYSEGILKDADVSGVLMTLHRAASKSGLFDESHIKTRAYKTRHFTNAGKIDPFVHIQARIKSGRNADEKKGLSAEIINSLIPLKIKTAVLTVEIIDMDKDSYSKHKPD